MADSVKQRLERLLEQSVDQEISDEQVIAAINSSRPPAQRFVSVDSRDEDAAPITSMFKRFRSSDIVENSKQTVTTGMWTGGTGSLASFFSSSAQSSSNSGLHYFEILHEASSSTTSEKQFAIAYGHVNGGGSLSIGNNASSVEPTKAVYAQYRNILLDPSDSRFTFAGNTSGSEDFYAISINKNRFKEKMDPGNWELHLQSGSILTSKIKLIDDSSATLTDAVGEAGRVYNVVSGTVNLGTNSTTINTAATNQTGGGFGLFYPDVGIVILNTTAISASFAALGPSQNVNDIAPVTTSDANYQNHQTLFNMITNGGYFLARSAEDITSAHYFARAGNKEFNFSNNPTFTTGSNGEFKQPSFFENPITYITTVGLYNDDNELLAVAKVSKPQKKSFSNETLFKTKIDF